MFALRATGRNNIVELFNKLLSLCLSLFYDGFKWQLVCSVIGAVVAVRGLAALLLSKIYSE